MSGLGVSSQDLSDRDLSSEVIGHRVEWIAAEAEPPGPADPIAAQPVARDADGPVRKASFVHKVQWNNLPAHNFPAPPAREAGEASEVIAAPEVAREAPAEITQQAPVAEDAELDDPLDRNPDLYFYRGRTTGMLRRYLQFSLDTGRLPSLLGREFFRAKVTAYRATSFEDRVIFVRDVERCLEKLDEFSRQVLGCLVLKEHDPADVARTVGCTRMTIHRKLMESLDRLSEIFLDAGLIKVQPEPSKKSCQEGEAVDFRVSDCNEDK
jgi:hypothetical protein